MGGVALNVIVIAGQPTAVWSSRVLSVLRIVAALLFIEHGTMKLLHFPIAQPGPLSPLLLAASTIEIVCGVLLAIGLFTWIAGLLASGEMAVAYFVSHLPNSFWPGVNGGKRGWFGKRERSMAAFGPTCRSHPL